MDRSTEEAVCSLQAQLHVQALALRALAATHPDPAALLSAWRQHLTEAEAGPAAGPAHGSAHMGELCRAHAEDWTAELVELALPRLEPDQRPASPGTDVRVFRDEALSRAVDDSPSTR